MEVHVERAVQPVQPRTRPRDSDSSDEDVKRRRVTTETDPRRLSQRRKEISYGKNTLGYDRYTRLVPKARRKPGHPRTPDPTLKVSKRQFDGLVRAWRRKLHDWDPPESKDLVLVKTATVLDNKPVVEDVAQVEQVEQVEWEDDGLGPQIFVTPPLPEVEQAPEEEEEEPPEEDEEDSDDDLL